MAIIQGGFFLTGAGNSTPWTWIAGLLAVAIGLSLFVGFLTPLAGLLVGLGTVGIALSSLPASTANLFDGKLSTALAVTMNAAIVLLGPGAFSVDARLFGRREIIIPHAPRPPKS
jgi:uncharacterized membrane protein YphA (DoxX/SURF4 family)